MAGGLGMTASNVAPLRKTRPCPECGRPSTRESYPFCSERCRNLDLSRWLSGSYAIPVAEDETKVDEDDVPPRSDRD
jgi:endogenous inhibitor of DNA gyrase (YacG/DUF329 family)